MESYQIQYINSIPEQLESLVHEGHIKDEAKHGVVCDFNKFSILLMDAKDEMVAVLFAYTAYKEIYVDDIWVDPNFRKQGCGRKLLENLEKHYKGLGYNNINLVTSEFQAPEFYKKCGFELEFVRVNKQFPKFNKYFFVKFFEK